MVSHAILLTKLNQLVGLQDTVINWSVSYLSDQSFNIMIGDSVSPFVPLTSGIHQGYILGPVIFNLYIVSLGFIFKKHNVEYHLYADDCQLYVPIKPKDRTQPLADCRSDVKGCLATDFLLLNDTKTEANIFIGQYNFSSLSLELKTSFSNLGVTMDTHVNHVVRSCFFHLTSLSKIKNK